LHNYGGNIQIEKKDGIKNSLDRCACYHLWLAPAIAWNGDILWCCNDPQHKTVWENIKKHTLKDFWQSDELKILREEHKEGIYREPCKSCNVWQTYPSIF
jgi:radical SAM protein with 4Fe4S-binding SPASM domain